MEPRRSRRDSTYRSTPTKSKEQSLADARSWHGARTKKASNTNKGAQSLRVSSTRTSMVTTVSRKVNATEGAHQSRRISSTRTSLGTTVSRKNNATEAVFTNDELKKTMEGTFMKVAKGKYIEGERAGESCVCKWFKTGMVEDEKFFDKDIMAMHKAKDFARAFNKARIIDKEVKVNVGQVWTYDSDAGLLAGKKVLIEPLIHGYRKFNSNSGWADNSSSWAKAMQALSHYSYHVSSGKYLLCDLQGGVYDKAVVLTDPVIMSENQCYGVTDLGQQGIVNFFSKHVCNKYCDRNWRSPAKQKEYFRAVAHTKMINAKVSSKTVRGGPGHHVTTCGPTYNRYR